MKSIPKPSRLSDRYSMVEPLEARIAPAAATVYLPTNPFFVTATAGSGLILHAGEVLTTGTGGTYANGGGGGTYLLYVAKGEVVVHTEDLNHNNQTDPNEITGLSVGAGAIIVSFVDIHGDIVTDLLPNGTLSDNGAGDILQDAGITEIDMRSLTTNDFAGNAVQTPSDLVDAHLALSSYSIFGSIYSGGSFGLANDASSGLVIDTSGDATQASVFTGFTGNNLYTPTTPYVGSIYVGSSASGMSFNLGISGGAGDLYGKLFSFVPATGEPGASIYNVSGATTGDIFNIGTLHAGNGGFNAPGGSIYNVALNGNNSGAVHIIAGDAGTGTVGKNGGSIINFSASDAILGAMILQSGSGGLGLTGAGGSAGQINVNPAGVLAVNAHLVLQYGNGGAGYTGGGNGGGTQIANIAPPNGVITTILTAVTTMHTDGSIGSTTPFDFNGDGLSDAVYSTTNPNQVVVAFGNGTSLNTNINQATSYAYLNSLINVDGIVVGDFLGNGHPDIAVVGGTASYGGVEVYLSQYSPTGKFLGFSDPLFSALPNLTTPGFQYTAISITSIVAGDFWGVGQLGLAVNAIEQVNPIVNELIFLHPELVAAGLPGGGHGTGYFYPSYAAGVPYTGGGSILLATALTSFTPGTPGTQSAHHDVVIVSNPGTKTFSVVDDSPIIAGLAGGPVTLSTNNFGMVDTNRIGGQTSLAQFTVQGITVTQDVVTPGVADIVALSVTPVSFLSTFAGNGLGTFTLTSGSGADQSGIDFTQSTTSHPVAIRTVPNPIVAPSKTPAFYSDVAILDYDTGGTGNDRVYTLDFNTVVTNNTTMASTTVDGIQASTATTTAGITGYTVNAPSWSLTNPVGGANNAEIGFDVYYPLTTSTPSPANPFGFLVAIPVQADAGNQGFNVGEPNGITLANVPFKEAGIFFNGGNGGSSEDGPGGNGGSFGSSLTISGSTAVGSLSLVFPTDPTYQGAAVFIGGNGGNGFTRGGDGGSLVGISVTYGDATILSGTAVLEAGNGGESLIGPGGNGGSESQLFVIRGAGFFGGNGGVGLEGGAGGSLTGNPTSSGLFTALINSSVANVLLEAGTGATGIIGGGAGGSIVNFVNQFESLIGGVAGSLEYLAGNAGNAVAGHTGVGGSIIDSSPSVIGNTLTRDIVLQAGNGGTGLFATAGGNITNFDEVPTINTPPASFTIIAGFGGNATLGNGGAGGSIANVTVEATGIGAAIPVVITYNRMVAGAGGLSLGAAGGVGGSVDSINTTSVGDNSQDVTAAGAGGAGLSAGGAGGSVSGAIMDAGATGKSSASGKVVVIAGDGGMSGSVVYKNGAGSTPLQVAFDLANSIGGVNGPGGEGGNITNFTQPTSTNTHVDLIAGNGGDTPNHSFIAGNATFDNSGKGGSITNIACAGSIGNTNSTVPIISYNNIFTGVTTNGVTTGTSMQDFVDNYIIASTFATPFPLSDAVGNVGLVAGAAGRVENTSPTLPTVASTDGVNGSVSNIHAQAIMSMIAGNVDRVDLIQNLSNFGATLGPTAIGSSKTVYYDPQNMTLLTAVIEPTISLTNPTPLSSANYNYISNLGGYVNNPLPGGGELIDGAIMAKNIPVLQSPRQF